MKYWNSKNKKRTSCSHEALAFMVIGTTGTTKSMPQTNSFFIHQSLYIYPLLFNSRSCTIWLETTAKRLKCLFLFFIIRAHHPFAKDIISINNFEVGQFWSIQIQLCHLYISFQKTFYNFIAMRDRVKHTFVIDYYNPSN